MMPFAWSAEEGRARKPPGFSACLQRRHSRRRPGFPCYGNPAL